MVKLVRSLMSLKWYSVSFVHFSTKNIPATCLLHIAQVLFYENMVLRIPVLSMRNMVINT